MTPQLTGAGKNILMRALAGETINFTKIQLGNGPAQVPATATALENPLLTVQISDIDIGDEYVTLVALFSNSSITNGFHITEAGFFVEDPDDSSNELLYAIGSEDESSADFVPSNANRILEMRYDALIFIGDAENVTAAISGSLVYATKEAFDAHTADNANPHGVTKAQVGLGNVPNVATNDQTPTYTDTTTLATLTSGEKISIAFAKIKLAITRLISHLSATNNPHNVTASQVGAAARSHTHDASSINSGVVSPARGGTGLSAPAVGGLLRGNGSGAMGVVRGEGALFSPTYGDPRFGILPASMGGTGKTSLAALAASLVAEGLAKIVTGTYTGTGTYGSNAPTGLTSFASAPKLLVVMPQENTENAQYGGFIVINGVTSLRGGGINDDVTTNAQSQLYFTWSSTGATWYGSSAVHQQNINGRTYRYIAIL